MRCPKCESEFETFTHAGVEIDRCTGCGGIWFDALERERLQQAGAARQVDRARPRGRSGADPLRSIRCPRCDVELTRVADRTQFHIEYEACPKCSGSFFDAGEFRDLAEVTVIERFKKMIDVWLAVR